MHTPPAITLGNLTIDPPLLQAPMAGFSNSVYRQILRRFGGVGLPATEMVSARGLYEMERRGEDRPDRLTGVRDEPRPLAVQIWDNSPETLAEVAQRLVEEYRVSVVDINFGCPVRAVSEKAQSGSYLLREPDRIGEIIDQVVRVCGQTPVTAKIRLGPDENQIVAGDVAQAVEGAGGAALTVHGRTARQMFRGKADWEQIAKVKPFLKRIPLIGNGDITSAEQAVEAFECYAIDGLMIGRAALARPWLFAQVAAAIRSEPIMPDLTLQEQRDLLLEQLDLTVERFGVCRGVVLMRTYACCYATGQRGVRQFRRRVASAKTVHEFRTVINEDFPQEISPL
ncbi:MAG: tRNA-dihydrouridine synthase [Planctomycetia bacterium]